MRCIDTIPEAEHPELDRTQETEVRGAEVPSTEADLQAPPGLLTRSQAKKLANAYPSFVEFVLAQDSLTSSLAEAQFAPRQCLLFTFSSTSPAEAEPRTQPRARPQLRAS